MNSARSITEFNLFPFGIIFAITSSYGVEIGVRCSGDVRARYCQSLFVRLVLFKLFYNIFILEKVHFSPSKFFLSLVWVIELQNRISLTIKLLKPLTIDHWTVLIGDSYGHTFITMSSIF
jgi:hypothetical protein